MQHETIRARLTSTPGIGLIMDNGDRADPKDFIGLESGRLTATRAKNRTAKQIDMIEDLGYIGGFWSTEPVHVALQDDEWIIEGGGNLCLITEAIESMILGAATRHRLGQKAKTAFLLEGPYCLLIDGKPLSVADAWAQRDEFYIRRRVRTGIGKSKRWVISKRPIFREWSAVIDFNFFPDELDGRQVAEILNTGGRYEGIGNRRPKYGRFDVEILNGSNGGERKG